MGVWHVGYVKCLPNAANVNFHSKGFLGNQFFSLVLNSFFNNNTTLLDHTVIVVTLLNILYDLISYIISPVKVHDNGTGSWKDAAFHTIL